MKILCPRCGEAAAADQVNVQTDVAFCVKCGEGFRISESIDTEDVTADVLRNPPGGAWFRQEMDRVVVGATTRSAAAFFLVPFMCVWSGFSLGGIYGTQIASGKFNLIMSLFGIPFVLGSVLFWALALMAVCGKVEVSIGRSSSVFTGVGRLGWRRSFDWTAAPTVREEAPQVTSRGRQPGPIVLEGAERLAFGSGLSEKRKYFMLSALKYLLAQSRPDQNVLRTRSQ